MPLFNHMPGNTSKSNIDKVQRLLAGMVTNNFNNDIPTSVIIKELFWQTVFEWDMYITLLLMFNCVNGSAPDHLSDEFCHVEDQN